MTCTYAFNHGKMLIIDKLQTYCNEQFERHINKKKNLSSQHGDWWRYQGRIDELHDLMSKISEWMGEDE